MWKKEEGKQPMNTVLTSVFGIAGGLAMFLFGMTGMSEALQKAAGEKMKAVLSFLTRNRVMGALAGALVTAVLQSSSATTVMTIGFVSAGLMTLSQAISVIFGANIGTTMTAQLIAFQISDYIYPIIFAGFLIQFLSKKENVKNIGLVIFYFGLLFEGIEIMSSVMKPVANSPIFTELMGKVKDIPILGILLGLGMTLIVQSSSATIAILQSFAAQAGPDGVSSVIGLAGAIPILLGDNIGTTITALLASIGQSRDARRTAIAHSVFNITGTMVFAFFIPQFAAFVRWISPKGPEISVISRQIANAHTTFNVVCTLVWVPLLPLMVKIVKGIIPDRQGAPARKRESALDIRVISQPAAALTLVCTEIRRELAGITGLLSSMGDLLLGKEKNPAAFRTALAEEKDRCRDVSEYISAMFSIGSLTKEQAEEASGFLVLSNNADRISDRCHDIVQHADDMAARGTAFSEEAGQELKDCLSTVAKIYGDTVSLLEDAAPSLETAGRISRTKVKLRKRIKGIEKAHLARVKEKKCDASLTPVFVDILYNMDRISDNCLSLSEEALAGTTLIAREVPELPKERQQTPSYSGMQ